MEQWIISEHSPTWYRCRTDTCDHDAICEDAIFHIGGQARCDCSADSMIHSLAYVVQPTRNIGRIGKSYMSTTVGSSIHVTSRALFRIYAHGTRHAALTVSTYHADNESHESDKASDENRVTLIAFRPQAEVIQMTLTPSQAPTTSVSPKPRLRLLLQNISGGIESNMRRSPGNGVRRSSDSG